MIVCGTDFSNASRDALDVAASLARRLRKPLLIVHVVRPPDDLAESEVDIADETSRSRMDEEVKRVQTSPGLSVEGRTIAGWADESIVHIAEVEKASLIVIGAVGHRKGTHWLIGSVAERIAKTTTVPLLLVRNGAALMPWIEGRKKNLRLLIGTDFSPVSDHALHWLSFLRDVGACDLAIVHISNPVAEYVRLDIPGQVFRSELHPIVEEVLTRELKKREGAVDLGGSVQSEVKLSMRMPAVEIARLAEEKEADAVIVGLHQRRGSARVWFASQADGVIHGSSTNVICIPYHTADEPLRALEAPNIKTLLAATDFSATGNRAVAWAMAAAPPGANVVVMNVAAGESNRSAAATALSAMTGPEGWQENVRVSVEAVESDHVARTICATAERIGADLIIVGSRGHGAAPFVGSVARDVLAGSERPVLIVRERG